MKEIVLLNGSSNPQLFEDIQTALRGVLDTETTLVVDAKCVSSFSDGETKVRVNCDLRNRDVYIVQPLCGNVNDSCMQLFLLLDTCRASSAKKITAVVPYMAYARQDRKTESRVPISAALVAKLIEASGAHRVVIVDVHSGQTQGFFAHAPADNLFAENIIVKYIKGLLKSKGLTADRLMIVSPDAGGVTRAKRIADKVTTKEHQANVVTIIKRRAVANVVESAQLMGDVRGFLCIIVDDMIDTAGTLCKAADLLADNGATGVYACATHGVFSGAAAQNVQNCQALQGVVITDSIPHAGVFEVVIDRKQQFVGFPKLEVLSLAPLLADAIHRLHCGKSLSELFMVTEATD